MNAAEEAQISSNKVGPLPWFVEHVFNRFHRVL